MKEKKKKYDDNDDDDDDDDDDDKKNKKLANPSLHSLYIHVNFNSSCADAYKTLYTSSVTFGIKKQLKAEQGIPALEEAASALEDEKASLELELQELRSKFDMMEKRENERRNADEKRRKEELDFLKYQGQHLDSFLKQMNSAK